MSRYLSARASNYDKNPSVAISGHRLWSGAAVWEELRTAIAAAGDHPLIAIDSYPGTDLPDLGSQLSRFMPDFTIVNMESAALPSGEIDALLQPHLTDDRVFGVMSRHVLIDFYDSGRLAAIAAQLRVSQSPMVVFGWGATLLDVEFDLVVLAELPRWEIQQRYRRGAPNWHCLNADEAALGKIKRGYFIEWRVADRHKETLFDRVDYVIDTTISAAEAKLIRGDTFRTAMAAATTRPFRVTPYFDPGAWGGQWMQEVFDLEEQENYAWGFDCVPEENSIVFEIDGDRIELPAIDVILMHPTELLGTRTVARFGAEFPIRFDLLDTMGGGNLSLQVHPMPDYIRETFGMRYTQDESYYLLDSADDAVVYLGLKDAVAPSEMIEALTTAQAGTEPFDVERFVNAFPARQHDHFLIPAGTVHCSGANSMVLEISATPYLFTFKMWDWGQVGLDGLPRPIHIDHAAANIQWNRDSAWTASNLVNNVQKLAEEPGWVEERTGLHELEFIEVRRHWFTGTVNHDTNATLNVLNLVQGAEAVVQSPEQRFEPFVVHYAETFIVPAAVGRYTISPHGAAIGQTLATVKAYVRGTTQEPVNH